MKKNLKKIISLIIIFSIIAYSNINIATTSEDLNGLEDERNSISTQINAAEGELEGIISTKSETLKQVEELISQISSYKTEIEDLQDKIKDLKNQIEEAEKKIKEDEIEYQKQRDLLDTRIVATYKGGSTSYLDFLLSSSSLMDFISSYYLIAQVVEYDQNLLEQVNAHKEKIEKEKEELEKSKKEVEKNEVTLRSKQAALEVKKNEKEEYAKQLTDEEKETEAKIQQLQDLNDEIDRKIKQAKAEIAAAKKKAEEEARKEAQQSPSKPTSAVSGGTASSQGLIWPTLTKYSITTGWYYSTGKLHGASDISGAGIYGTPIYAAADGYVITSEAKVDSAGHYIGYGNYVAIAHYNGLYTLYGHMSSRAVTAGSTVTQGQVIGYVGSTGNSTGPHLHFEVRTGNGTYSERVNPIYYLPTSK